MFRQLYRVPFRGLRLAGLVALLIVSFMQPLPTLAATSATVSEELNLRSGPGLSYRVLAIMPAGSAVQITGDAAEGWYPVTYNNLDGWAYAEYIAIGGQAGGAASSTNTAGGVRGSATVVTNLLNLRSGPGTSYNIIAQLPYGTTVQIVGDPQAADGHSWLEVTSRGYGQGWVAAAFLNAGETPAAAAAPAPTPTPEPAAAPTNGGGTIIEIITAAANRYGQSPAAMIAVARCESNLNPNAVNPRSNASGLFQFLPGTWRTTPYASYSIFDPWANANAAGWMWSVGRRGEWVC